MENIHKIRILLCIMIAMILIPASIIGQELEKVTDLSGRWKFSIGDNPDWANPNYDDSHWEKLWVPKTWEEQGFHGYDGYAWYRITIDLSECSHQLSYYLQLGYIDDVDEVFVNGKKIGFTGKFPPHFTTSYNAHRIYLLPTKMLHSQKEVTIAVRVYDQGGEGGIVHGDVAIMVDKSSVFTDFDLQGDWRFKTGDCSGIPDKMEYYRWSEIIVPGAWEDQGYKHYDGIACYVKEFELDGQFTDERVVLVLGRIDDLDMVYLNGELIGQSGEFTNETVHQRPDQYRIVRNYYIPPGVLNDNGKNILVVKVLDYTGLGGLWDGSVGLISQDNYINYWRKKRNSIQN